MPSKRKRATATEAITAEDFYELTFVSDPQLSPDGKRVAYVVQQTTADHKGYRSAIWISEAQNNDSKRLTLGTKRDHSPRWSPDGLRLIFVSNRSKKNQLWLIPIDGGEAEQLTHLANGATGPAWSPDGKKILFSSRTNAQERALEGKKGVGNDPLSEAEQEEIDKTREQEEAERTDPRVVERTIYRAGTEYFDGRQNHLYVLNLESRCVERISRDDADHVNPCWSPDGQYVYCGAQPRSDDNDHDRYDLLRYSLKGRRSKKLAQGQAWGLMPKPSPDGKYIAYLNRPEDRSSAQNSQLMIVSAAGKAPRQLAAALDRDFSQFEWRRDSKAILFTSENRGAMGLYAVSLKSDRVRQYLSGDRMVRSFSLAANADCMAYLVSTSAYPCDVFISDGTGNREQRLTRINAAFIEKKAVQPIEEIWYKSKDGTGVQGWWIKPPGFRVDRKYPLALEIHGGPHAMWSPCETTMWHEWQMLAAAGYVVFFCNPRGSEGYGFEFKASIHKDWGSQPTDDILSGVEAIVAKGFIDTKRLCVTGGSYGGYMTAWLIGHDERFAAAVSQRGVYDLLSFYGTTDVPRLIEWEFDARPWEDPMRLWEASPLAYAERMRTPLLILHSERDFRVPIPSAEGMYVALKKLGRKVKFVRFPEEGHELSRSGQPKRIVNRLSHILSWFDEHTKKK